MDSASVIVGFLLGLVPGLALLAYNQQKHLGHFDSLVQRIVEAFHAGVAVKLSDTPASAAAQLFHHLRNPRPSSAIAPPPKPEPIAPASNVQWNQVDPISFEFGMSTGQFGPSAPGVAGVREEMTLA